MDLQDFRIFLDRLFSGDAETLGVHHQMLMENPVQLFMLNIENIKSMHESAQKSAILFGRELSVLGKQLLQVQNSELPQQLGDSLFEILVYNTNTLLFIPLSTCIFRLTRIYLPEGQFSFVFDKIFQYFPNVSPEAKLALIDCLSLILRSKIADSSAFVPAINNLILEVAQLGINKSLTYALSLLYACVQSQESYPNFQQLIDFSQILVPTVEFKVLTDFWTFVEEHPTFFGEQTPAIFQSLIEIINSGEDKLKCIAMEIMTIFIDSFPNEFNGNALEYIQILTEMLCYKVDEFQFGEINTYIPMLSARDAIKRISKTYSDDPEIGNSILAIFEEKSEEQDPNAQHQLFMLIQATIKPFDDIFNSFIRSDIIPIIKNSFVCENTLIRYDAFQAFVDVFNAYHPEIEVIDEAIQADNDEIFSLIYNVIANETEDFCRNIEISALSIFIDKTSNISVEQCSAVLEIVSSFINEFPIKLLNIISTLAKRLKENFVPFCDGVNELINPVISSFGEENSDHEQVFAAFDVLCSLTHCLSGDDLERVNEMIISFISSIDVTNLTSSQRDIVNSAYGRLMYMVNTSQMVQQNIEVLIENILTAARMDIPYKEVSINEFEKDFEGIKVLCEDEGVYKLYELSDLQEINEGLETIFVLLSNTTGLSDIVDAVAEIAIKWMEADLSFRLTRAAFRVACMLPRHIDYEKFTGMKALFGAARSAFFNNMEDCSTEKAINFCDLFRVLLVEYNKYVAPSHKTIKDLRKILEKVTGELQMHQQKENSTCKPATQCENLLIRLVLMIRSAVTIRPELVEHIIPYTEFIPMQLEHGFFFYSILMKYTNVLDQNLNEIVQTIRTLNADLFIKRAASTVILAIIESGKCPQEIQADILQYMSELIGSLQRDRYVSDIETIFAVIRCLAAMPTEQIFNDWVLALLPLRSYIGFGVSEIAEFVFGMISNGIVQNQAVIDKFTFLIKEAVKSCRYLTNQAVITNYSN